MTRAYETWRLRTYDVWGGGPDDEDAEWQVNDVFDGGSIELPEDPTDDEILAAVKPNYSQEYQHRIEIDASSDGDLTIYLQLDNGYPLCELTRL